MHNFKWSIKSKLAAGARAAVGELDLRDIEQPSEWVFMELEKKCRNVLKKKRNTETVEKDCNKTGLYDLQSLFVREASPVQNG